MLLGVPFATGVQIMAISVSSGLRAGWAQSSCGWVSAVPSDPATLYRGLGSSRIWLTTVLSAAPASGVLSWPVSPYASS